MKRPTGKLMYCPKDWRSFSENQTFPDNIECPQCLEIIAELKDIKSKRHSGSRIPKKDK